MASKFLTLTFFAAILFVIVYSFQYSPTTRFGTLLVAIPAAILCAIQTAREFVPRRRRKSAEEMTDGGGGHADLQAAQGARRHMFEILACLVGLLLGIYLIGLLLTLTLFVFIYLKLHREKWPLTIILALSMFVLFYVVFHLGLQVELYPGLLTHF